LSFLAGRVGRVVEKIIVSKMMGKVLTCRKVNKKRRPRKKELSVRNLKKGLQGKKKCSEGGKRHEHWEASCRQPGKDNILNAEESIQGPLVVSGARKKALPAMEEGENRTPANERKSTTRDGDRDHQRMKLEMKTSKAERRGEFLYSVKKKRIEVV